MANLRYLKNRNRWWLRWHAKDRKTGYIFSGSKVFLEKAQAVSYYADIEAQEKLVRSGQVTPGESLSNVTGKYLKHITRHTKRTQQHYRMVIAKFLGSLPNGIVRIHQLEPAHIQEYLYLMEGNKNRTLNAHLTVIKAFCRFVSERYNIDNPAARIKLLTEEPPESRFLSKEEFQKVLDIAPPLARDRLIFLAHTGLRATEFSQLSAKNINPHAKSITITGKGRRRRTVPLNKSAQAVLPYVKPASRRALHQQFSLLAKRADIPSFGPHALRHYCATQLLLGGIPAATVSKIMGVSIRVIEKHYAHILTSDTCHATDVLDD